MHQVKKGEQELSKLHDIKLGMMRELLTGRIRLVK